MNRPIITLTSMSIKRLKTKLSRALMEYPKRLPCRMSTLESIKSEFYLMALTQISNILYYMPYLSVIALRFFIDDAFYTHLCKKYCKG